jgi:hypothetical protein
VAALIKDEFSLDAELVEGKRSEFTIWVGDQLVAEKSLKGFPSDEVVVARVRAALGR